MKPHAVPMQNEPQLSAEMEKQIEKILVDMEKHYCRLNGQDDGYLVKKATMRKLLATALEEEREKLLSEVDEAITKRVLPAPFYGNYKEDRLHQRWQVELNQLKGEK